MPCSPCSWNIQKNILLPLLKPYDLEFANQIGLLLKVLKKRNHSLAYIKERFNISSQVLYDLEQSKILNITQILGGTFFSATLFVALSHLGQAVVTLGQAGFWPELIEADRLNMLSN